MNNQDIVINLDIVPANDGEFNDPDSDGDEVPGLVNGADSSDDNSDSEFEPDDEDDIELEDVEDEPLEDFDDTDDDDDAPRRSQRQRIERDFYVPNQQSYMHAAVSDGPKVQLINPKMFDPMAVNRNPGKDVDLRPFKILASPTRS